VTGVRSRSDAAGLLEGHLAGADGHDRVALLDQPVEVQRGAADGSVVLDLAVERLLAPQRAVAVEHPHDVVGEAGQDRLVVGAPEALDVRLHDRLVRWQAPAPLPVVRRTHTGCAARPPEMVPSGQDATLAWCGTSPGIAVPSTASGGGGSSSVSVVWWGGGQPPIGVATQPPAALVDRAVMGAAQQGQVGQVGGAAIQPVAQVVGLVTPGVVEERDIPLMW
jgi:hypothetical protein